MATASVLVGVVNGVNTVLSADATLAAITDLKIFDGPPIVDRSSTKELWIGATGLEDDATTTFVRTPVVFGGGAAGAGRDEVITVPCAIWALRGETDEDNMATLRTAVAAVFNAVIAALAPSDLGLSGVFCGGVEVREGELRQMQTPDGYAVVLTFAVQATARI